jgi:hypothetical protein
MTDEPYNQNNDEKLLNIIKFYKNQYVELKAKILILEEMNEYLVQQYTKSQIRNNNINIDIDIENNLEYDVTEITETMDNKKKVISIYDILPQKYIDFS